MPISSGSRVCRHIKQRDLWSYSRLSSLTCIYDSGVALSQVDETITPGPITL